MLSNRPGGISRRETRANLVEVAARLLREHGAAAVTTRAVAQAAGVQAPTIYRLFGDKDGLLDAVTEHAFAAYVAGKVLTEESAADSAVNSAVTTAAVTTAAVTTAADSIANMGDPIAGLRAGWDVHIGFGLANAALFGLLTEPGRLTRSPAAAGGLEILRARVHRIAETGRLRVTERRAVDLIRAAGTGAVLTLLAMAPQDRDPGLADAMYDAVMRSILTDLPARASGSTTAAAVEFLTVVPDLPMLTDTERALLSEWLERAASG